jgi:ATP-dependent exoDNAse (exonuclease V) beta subunit
VDQARFVDPVFHAHAEPFAYPCPDAEGAVGLPDSENRRRLAVHLDAAAFQPQHRLPVLSVAPTRHPALASWNDEELARERVRLSYVATTRARDLLVLPRHTAPLGDRSWAQVVDLGLRSLPAIDPKSLGSGWLRRRVRARREGTYLWYSANADALRELLAFLYAECCTRNKAVQVERILRAR